MRILFTLTLLSVLSIHIHAQDHLLWFTGKKIKENVLVTAAGDTLIYSPSKGVLKLSSSKTKKSSSLDRMRIEMKDDNPFAKQT